MQFTFAFKPSKQSKAQENSSGKLTLFVNIEKSAELRGQRRQAED